MINYIKNDKKLLKMIFMIALPIALQNLLSTLTQMMDTIMVGELGDVQLTASSLANQVFFIYILLIFGGCGGAGILTAQYWGKNEIEPIKIIIGILGRLAIITGIAFSIFIFFFPEFIMRIFSPDPLVIEEGVAYLKIVAPTYLFFGIANVFVQSFRTVEKVKLAVIANATTLVINVTLNYILIFGKFGFPALGLQGAAYATLIARFIEFIVVMIYVMFFEKQLRFKIKYLFVKNKMLMKDIKKYCMPVLLNELIWSLGITMQAALFGNISTTAVSANTIIGVVQNLATLMIFGVANASAVIIGKTIGEGNIELAKKRGKFLEIFAIIMGVVAGGIILLCRDVMVDFYNVEEATKILAKQMLIGTSIVIFFLSNSATAIIGILRGGGDAKFSLIIEIISLWCVAVPLGYLAGLVFKMPIIVVYLLFKSDELIKSVLCWIRLAGDKWIQIVTRDSINDESRSM